MFAKAFVFALLAVGATATADSPSKMLKKVKFEKPDLELAKEEIIDSIKAKLNETKLLVEEAKDTVSLKAEVLEKIAEKVKDVNVTAAKLKKLKEYDAVHPVIPKANLTIVKPVLKLQLLKPNKTAVKMEIEHMVVKDSKMAN